MKRVLVVVFGVIAFCLPTVGQIRYIAEDGKDYKVHDQMQWEGLPDYIFSYRTAYGRYPDDKQDLLDFCLEIARFDSDHSISYNWEIVDMRAYTDENLRAIYLAKRDSVLTELINDSRNELTVSGDTCLFSLAEERGTIQCVGGPEDLLKYDYDDFRSWIGSSCYDKDGRLLLFLREEAPPVGSDITRKFRYFVTIHYFRDGVEEEDWTMPVLIPFTMTRSGAFHYDLSCLEGVQLFYQERGKPFESTSIMGTIAAEEAIDQGRLDAVKAHWQDFMDKHEEVDSIKTWELVLFNNPPDVIAKQ